MAKNPTSPEVGNIAGEVPRELYDAFDAAAERLGIAKKRLLAAAIAAFCDQTHEEQISLYMQAHAKYYAKDEKGA